MTPDQVHFGQVDDIHDARQQVLDRAFLANPQRFDRAAPRPPGLSQTPEQVVDRV